MTTITYDRDDLSVKTVGHAGYAEEGQDIVCASITSLMYALGSYAMELDSRGMLYKAPRIRLNEGDAEVSIRVIGLYAREARMTFDAVCDVFEGIRNNYPENVKYTKIYEGI